MKDFQRWRRQNGHEDVSGDIASPWAWQKFVTMEVSGELWKESREILKDALLRELTFLSVDDTMCYPVGLIHPYHILTSSVVVDLMMGNLTNKRVLYSESPYNDAHWTSFLEESHPWILIGDVQKYEYPIALWSPSDKEEIFKDVYPTEMTLFRYSYQPIVFGTARLYANHDPGF